MILDNYQQQKIASEISENIALEKNLIIIDRLKPKFFTDGEKYCYLLGELPNSCVAGFGDTPYLALIDFVKNFYEQNCKP